EDGHPAVEVDRRAGRGQELAAVAAAGVQNQRPGRDVDRAAVVQRDVDVGRARGHRLSERTARLDVDGRRGAAVTVDVRARLDVEVAARLDVQLRAVPKVEVVGSGPGRGARHVEGAVGQCLATAPSVADGQGRARGDGQRAGARDRAVGPGR